MADDLQRRYDTMWQEAALARGGVASGAQLALGLVRNDWYMSSGTLACLERYPPGR